MKSIFHTKNETSENYNAYQTNPRLKIYRFDAAKIPKVLKNVSKISKKFFLMYKICEEHQGRRKVNAPKSTDMINESSTSVDVTFGKIPFWILKISNIRKGGSTMVRVCYKILSISITQNR